MSRIMHAPRARLFDDGATWPTIAVLRWWALTVLGLGTIGVFATRFLPKGATLVVLAVPALTMLVLMLLRPQLGLYAVILCSGFVRFKAGTGTGSAIVASLGCAAMLCACWLINRALHRQRLIFLPPQIIVPGLALAFFVFFSILWGRATLDPRVSMPPTFLRVQIAASLLFFVSIGLLFIGADLLRDRRARNGIVAILIAIGLFALPFQAIGVYIPIYNVFGLFGVWFVALCWGQALANDRLPPPLRWLLGAAAIGWVAIQLSRERDWVSGWFPPLIALVLVTVILRPRIGLPALATSLALAFIYQDTLNALMISEEDQGSLGGDFGRFGLWARGLEVLQDHLVFGTGPAGYALYYVSLVPDKAMSMHNNYMDILAETGVFGLLSFVALLIGLGWLGYTTLPTLREPSDRVACAAALAGLVAVAQGMMLGDWVIPFVYNQTIAGFDHAAYTWLMFAVLCGLWAQQHRPARGADA